MPSSQARSLSLLFQAAAAEDRQQAVLWQARQRGGEAAQQGSLVLVRMQAADVADHPGLVGQAQLPARTQALDLLGLQRSDVDAVVERLDPLRRPLRQATADIVAHRVGHRQQAQALAHQAGEDLARQPLVIAEGVVHANDRQTSGQAGDPDRLEAVRDAEAEVARTGDLAQVADRLQLEATDVPGAVLEEQYLVGGATRRHLRIGTPGEEHRGDLVRGSGEQAGVLTGTVEERPVVAVTELQDARFSRPSHTSPRPPSRPGCPP